MPNTVVLGAARTPFGRLGGGLSALPATQLGIHAGKAALARAGVEPADVGYVVMGEVLQAGVGMIPSRQVSAGVGCPREVGSETINKVCASGLRAANYADLLIRAGVHDVVLAGGMESMSNAPYLLPKGRFGYGMGDGSVLDHMTHDGLTSTFDGLTWASRTRSSRPRYGCSREDQDAWALRSHQRAVAAIDAGPSRRDRAGHRAGRGVTRSSTPTRARAATPRPRSWRRSGRCSGRRHNHRRQRARRQRRRGRAGAGERGVGARAWPAPLARIVAQGHSAADCAYLVRHAGVGRSRGAAQGRDELADVDLSRSTRPSARSSLSTIDLLDADPERSTSGRRRRLGHPIGASGARARDHAGLQLRRRGGGIGLAAICSGAAQGDAIAARGVPAVSDGSRVVGAGQMGAGIAQVAAVAGFDVTWSMSRRPARAGRCER